MQSSLIQINGIHTMIALINEEYIVLRKQTIIISIYK